MEPFDLILRTAAATQLLFLALLLLLRSARQRELRYAACLPAGLAAFAATSAPGAELGALTVPLTVVCVANPVWFWLFTEALFDDDFRIEVRHAVALAAMILVGTAHELRPELPARAIVHAAFLLLPVAFIALALARVARGRAADLLESRRRWRGWFVVGVAAYGIAALLSLALFGPQAPVALARLNMMCFLAVALGASLALVAPRTAHDSRQPASAAAPTGEPVRAAPIDEALAAQVRDAMRVRRLYRDENLTVAGLARALGSQEYLVRRAINRGLGYRNFNEFLHDHRLGEAAPRLLGQPHLPILSIALDVGYGSIGPFNRAFRRRYGKTPTEYRAQAAAPKGVAPA